MHNIHFLF